MLYSFKSRDGIRCYIIEADTAEDALSLLLANGYDDVDPDNWDMGNIIVVTETTRPSLSVRGEG